ncbi:MAG: methionine--tRNA ligase [Candidatus Aenigmatarchaeota archaeon]|nr:MAG: methionine--tRNA ligase [Candidatus Aenigmarchaeota archaeon]
MVVRMKFYITTPIYYVNDVASIGHAYTTIAADVIARFYRLLGHDVFYLTGLDENSQKTVQAARKLGVKDIQKYTNSMAKKWKHVWKVLNISNEGFIRTTEDRHKRVVYDFFSKVHKKGDIYKGKYEGLYCEGCEAFVTESDLIEGKCPLHKEEPKRISEDNYFFRLSKYQDRLLKHIEKNPDFIQPSVRRNEVLSFVKEGLKDISISRPTQEWGIPLPIDRKHVIWVWFDALLNYVSGAENYWPADMHLMAKDIIRFHCIIWPCMLMSAGYKLPKKIFAHGFLTVNGQKMSKSLGNVIDPLYLSEKFGVDQIRYYLLRGITFGEDGDFSTNDLADRVNNELVANISNFCYRTLSFINRYSKSRTGKLAKDEWEKKLSKEIEKKIENIHKCYLDYNFRDAIKQILEIGDIGNRYFQEKQPWVLIKDDPKKCSEVLSFSANIVKDLSILLKPVLPEFSKNLEKQLNSKDLGWKDMKKPLENHKTGKAEILFRKVATIQEDPFAYLDLKVARVEKIEEHPEAEKLYVLKINLGTEKRTLVAGLKGHYSKKELEGKNIIVIANLKPAKIKGIESKGMLLAVESRGKIGLLTTDDKEGADVFIEGIERKPKKVIGLKDFLKLGLKSVKGGVYYKDKILKTDKSEISVDRGMDGKVS